MRSADTIAETRKGKTVVTPRLGAKLKLVRTVDPAADYVAAIGDNRRLLVFPLTELAELLRIDAPAVTRKAQQLERAGLVSRTRDEQDARATRLQLTPEGGQVINNFLAARRAAASWPGSGLSSSSAPRSLSPTRRRPTTPGRG